MDVLDNAQLAAAAAAQPASAPAPAPPAQSLEEIVEHDLALTSQRVLALSRWAVLLFAAIVYDLAPQAQRSPHFTTVNIILGGWAIFNLAYTAVVLRKTVISAQSRFVITALDVGLACAAVFFTGGFTSLFVITFAVALIAAAWQYGNLGSLAGVAAVTAGYLFTGLAALPAGQKFTSDYEATYVRNELILLLSALMLTLLHRDYRKNRTKQLKHTYELEALTFKQLIEVDRIKSEFIMLASHELRTPLTKIKAWVTLMQETGDRLPAEARREGILELRAETEHLGRLTDNLLAIAQIESGDIQLHPVLCDVRQVVLRSVGRFSESADTGRFEIDLAPEAGSLAADEDKLTLVLTSLLDNALKFSPADKPIGITASKHGRKVRIGVHDHGRRIPESDVERVFASFYQVESPLIRQRGGFGVGLYLARQLIERMGGNVWLDNRHTAGNTFIVSLPAHLEMLPRNGRS